MEKLIKLGGGWSLNPIETEGLTADEIQDLLSISEDPFVLREISLDAWFNSFARLTCDHIEVGNYSIPLLGHYEVGICNQPEGAPIYPDCVYYPTGTEGSLPILCGHKSIIDCPYYIINVEPNMGLCNSLSAPICVYFPTDSTYSMGIALCGHGTVLSCPNYTSQSHTYTLPMCKHPGLSIIYACLDNNYSNCVEPPYVYPETGYSLKILPSKYPGFLKLSFELPEDYSVNVFVGDVYTLSFSVGNFINRTGYLEAGTHVLEWDTIPFCKKLTRKPAFVGIYGRNNTSSIFMAQRIILDNRKVVTGTAAFMTEMTIDLSSGIIDRD